jgi:hypothetical protein
VPNNGNTPDIIIRDDEKKNMYVNTGCHPRKQKCDNGAEKILKYKDLTIEIQRM